MSPVGQRQARSEAAKRAGLQTVDRRRSGLLAAIGSALIAVWVLGLALPASIVEYRTPVPWTAPIAAILGRDFAGLLHFLLTSVALWTLYAAALVVARKAVSPTDLRIAVGVSLLLVAVALVMYPGGSRDIWHNIADGRLIAKHGQNPMVVTPFLFSRTDPGMAALSAWDFIPSASHYGPLWYIIAALLAVLCRESLLANLFAFKLVNALFLLGCLFLCYRLAQRLRLGRGTFAVVIFGWSPLMLWSSAIDGHNDVVMVFFVLAGVHELVSHRSETAIPLLFLGGLTKYVALLLLPAFVVYAWRTSGKRSLPSSATGLAGGLCLSLALWLPFWQGPATLKLLRESATGAVQTPTAALLFIVPIERASILEVPPLVGAVLTAAFLGCFVAVLTWLWLNARSGEQALHWACAAALMAYLYLQLWWFWPQYVGWLLPFAAILAARPLSLAAIVFSATAMLIVMFHGWWWTLVGVDQAAYNIAVAGAVFIPPLLVLTGAAWWRARREPRDHAEREIASP